MAQPKLTIGMATYQDWDGVYFTIQSLRMQYPHLMSEVEFVVVNNNHGADKTVDDAINGLLSACRAGGCAGAKYVPMLGPVGTSPSRENIFTHATGEFVMVMDCHVLLTTGALDALFAYYKKNPKTNDLITGPLVYDNLQNYSTHFNDVWRAEMWGTWGQAWQCKCSPTKGITLTMLDVGGLAVPHTLQMPHTAARECPACGRLLPTPGWAGHERAMQEAGLRELGHNSNDKAFEIPGQGLGLFTCRREAWLHFNENARGFGGEEMYIHTKFRQAGHKALCLPALKWLHRFFRVGGAKYPLTRYLKVRNYVLELQELGLSLDPVYREFVIPGLISQNTWDMLVQSPEMYEAEPNPNGGNPGANAGGFNLAFADLEQLFNDLTAKERDLNQHMPRLRELAAMAGGTVCELTARKESTVALLAGRPGAVVAYSTEVEQYVRQTAAMVQPSTSFMAKPYTMGAIVGDMPENNLLFIDTFHRYLHLLKELTTYAPQCKRYIVLHDTTLYGGNGDDGGPGLRRAIMEFTQANPQWAVISHTDTQYGLTVLSCVAADHPAEPIRGFAPPSGPGTELKAILHSLDINPVASCDCNSRANQMDAWGVQGCRDRIDEIVGWMRDGGERWGWVAGFKAASKAVLNGLAFKLNPLDPFPSLVREAINVAERKELEKAKEKKA